ncbi:LuxR C-terminal-related transcriptional regulator [Arhodomonas sp. SL1]|uniref:helix-turn-helix transcriptional regulator n=1 Tax=Arhodomonas sp. SL1 TaxID=3425691 RepID=UPI003F88193F
MRNDPICEQITSSDSLAAAMDTLGGRAADLGFIAVHYVLLAQLRSPDGGPAPQMASMGFGVVRQAREWMAYVEQQQRYVAWPLHGMAMATTLPFSWQFTLGERCSWKVLDGGSTLPRSDLPLRGGEVGILRACKNRTGVDRGLTVPLHDSAGRFGILNFVTPDTGVLEHIDPTPLWLAAHHFHDLVRANSREVALRSFEITNRQLECLRYAALGKTNAEIGAILGVSQTTVRFHLDTAAERLNAANRVNLVAKAVQTGLVERIL